MSEEKTEEPTEGKKRQARSKGQVVKSQELVSALTLAVSFAVVVSTFALVTDFSLSIIKANLTSLAHVSEPLDSLRKTLGGLLGILAVALLPPMVASAAVGLLFNLVTTQFNLSAEAVKPDPNKLNPLNTLKRWFGKKTLAEALKIGLKTWAMLWVVKDFCANDYESFFTLSRSQVDQFGNCFQKVVGLAWRLVMVQAVFGVADYGLQYYEHRQGLKMSKQEVKDEHKKQEGDPMVKAQRRARGRRMIKASGMNNLKKASVVVTNPTHLAVALEYNMSMGAPIVVTKGADHVAFEIRRRAAEMGIPMVEDKPLARALFPLELQQTIPPELFRAVAELLLSVKDAEDYS